MLDREDFRSYIVEYLMGYFDEEPCIEIVDEVLGYLEIHEGMTESDAIEALEAICDEMFS